MVPRKCTDVNKFCGATDIFSIHKNELKFLCWPRDISQTKICGTGQYDRFL